MKVIKKITKKIKDTLLAYQTVLGVTFRADKPLFFAYAGINMAVKFIPLLSVLLWQKAVDSLTAAFTAGTVQADIWWTLSMYLLIGTLLFVLQEAMGHIGGRLGTKQGYLVDLLLMKKHAAADAAFFDDPAHFDTIASVQHESGYVKNGSMRLTTLLSSIVAFVLSAAVLLGQRPLIALLFLFTCLPGCILEFICEDRVDIFEFKQIFEFRQKDYYKELLTSRTYAKELRVYNLFGHFFSKYRSLQRFLQKKLRKIYLSNMGLLLISSLLTYGAIVAFVIMFTKEAVGGLISVGTLTLYIGLMLSIKDQFVDIMVHVFFDLEDWVPHISHYREFMQKAEDIADTGTKNLPQTPPPTIRFSHVWFTYPGSQTPALQDVSFSLASGETMALVGVNGAGKTTIVKLLLRLYEPQSGQITLNDIDIREYSLSSLRAAFSVCFQTVTPYALTLAENIEIGDIARPSDQAALDKAIDMSDLRAVVNSFPMGLDTPMTRSYDKNGQEASDGQWQKISIARAFYRNSSVIVMDEPSSALDPLAEDTVFRSFGTLCQKRSGLLISHRLSGAMSVDKIVVIENGSVVEEGTHASLMAAQGRYAYMFGLQSENYRKAGESI